MTQCTVAGGAEFPVSLRPINRLHTKLVKDGSPCEVPKPVLNGMKDASWDPEKVPEPSHPAFPKMSVIVKQMLSDKCCFCMKPIPNPAFLAQPAEATDVVPLTW